MHVPEGSRLYGLKVGDLINTSLRDCDVDKLNFLFDKVHVDAILQIPISRHDRVNRLIWLGSVDGRFSVKFAYFQA